MTTAVSTAAGSNVSAAMQPDVTNRLEVFNQYRSLLFAIAYRMLGSVMDAEDMVQETFIRWQRAANASVTSQKAYLTTTITRLCIDRLRSARVRREQYIGTWLPEPIVTKYASDSSADPSAVAELADSLTVACLALLEKLSPIERAVFVLREAFGYGYSEIGRIIEKKPANCRQIAKRARQHITSQRQRFQASPQQQEQLTRKFIQASQKGDLQGLLDLLAKDITLWSDGGGQVVACLKPLQGAPKVAGFLRAVHRRSLKLGTKYEVALVNVNGQIGVLYALGNKIESLLSLEIVDSEIKALYFMRNPDKLKQGLSQPIIAMLSERAKQS